MTILEYLLHKNPNTVGALLASYNLRVVPKEGYIGKNRVSSYICVIDEKGEKK